MDRGWPRARQKLSSGRWNSSRMRSTAWRLSEVFLGYLLQDCIFRDRSTASVQSRAFSFSISFSFLASETCMPPVEVSIRGPDLPTNVLYRCSLDHEDLSFCELPDYLPERESFSATHEWPPFGIMLQVRLTRWCRLRWVRSKAYCGDRSDKH